MCMITRCWKLAESERHQWRWQSHKTGRNPQIMAGQGIERIPDSLGYLVLTEEGAVVSVSDE